jgi:hypothetical protein
MSASFPCARASEPEDLFLPLRELFVSERALLVELSDVLERVGGRRGSDRGRCRLALRLELVEARVLIGLALGSLLTLLAGVGSPPTNAAPAKTRLLLSWGADQALERVRVELAEEVDAEPAAPAGD